MGCDPARVRDVVVTHLHYDHAGSVDIFTGARIHIQDREMAFATGRHMCTACIRLPFEADHVVSMIRALYADKVQFHDGEGEVAPGVTVHRVREPEFPRGDVDAFIGWVDHMNADMRAAGLALGGGFDLVHSHDWLVADAARKGDAQVLRDVESALAVDLPPTPKALLTDAPKCAEGL